MRFKDRYGPWALITGASAGLGAEYAHQLAAKGLSLFLIARRIEKLNILAKEIKQIHQEIHIETIQLDLTQPKWRETLKQKVGNRQVGLLVNNAGFGACETFLETKTQRLVEMIRLNVEAVTVLAKDWLPPMVKRKQGGMMIISSTAGYQATPYMAVYGATKAYDLMLGEALAIELKKQNIDILAVSPGSTDTEFHEIAGVSKSAFGYTASAQSVVSQSLSLIGRRYSFVHGWINSFMTFLSKILPRKWVTICASKILRSRLN